MLSGGDSTGWVFFNQVDQSISADWRSQFYHSRFGSNTDLFPCETGSPVHRRLENRSAVVHSEKLTGFETGCRCLRQESKQLFILSWYTWILWRRSSIAWDQDVADPVNLMMAIFVFIFTSCFNLASEVWLRCAVSPCICRWTLWLLMQALLVSEWWFACNIFRQC